MKGIIDYDFLANKQRGLSPPSLEAMKMASYLKTSQKDVVYLLDSLEQAAACETIYFFTNKNLEDIPKEMFEYPNIKFYGKNFEKIPNLVQHMRPDISIYNNIIQKKLIDKRISAGKALQFLDSIYYQAYDDNGEKLPLPPSSTRKRFYIYDEDLLGKEDCWQVLDSIGERSPSSIYTVKPIQCHTIKQFLMLREDYEKVSRANKIILDYFVPLHQLEVYFGKYKLKLLGEITKTSNVRIYLGKNYGNNVYSELFYTKNLFYVLNLLFSYWSRNIPIRAEMYYNKEQKNPYQDIYNYVKIWANNDDEEMTLRQSFGGQRTTKAVEALVKKNSIFNCFLDKSKKDLITTRGIWRIP